MTRLPTSACALLTALLLVGCASRAPTPAPRPAAPVATAPAPPLGETRAVAPPPAPPKPQPLAAEQRWLAQLFDGTPVAISGDDAGVVHLSVPMVHSFDATSAAPKPALKVVLDKVGQSMKRKPGTKLTIATAARERAQAARAHLLARGIAAHRVAALGAAGQSEAIALHLAPPPPAIGRLDDGAPALQRAPGHQ